LQIVGAQTPLELEELDELDEELLEEFDELEAVPAPPPEPFAKSPSSPLELHATARPTDSSRKKKDRMETPLLSRNARRPCAHSRAY
jgi:hypothetical protein